ncbi:MAG: hypothetical protein KKI08_28205, partial [Armatimonadetes bacterium]|nr:hypothetical protein [Armatimonadota bacterium]
GHLVFSRQDGSSTPQHVLYRAPGKTTGELMAPSGTTLEKVGVPRLAVRDGLVGVVALDTTFRLHFSVRDDKTASWSADLQMPTVATMARIVAVRGKAAGEVVFHIVYRADSGGPRLVHQPVTCTRK